ncbi:hypothetical protein BLNAU_15585 [Blattamonas nauphoetae]|uniref:Uncharacterized protein n=1 Tax=Blattamonas nauphoetae TaxID=2049346 RepID=A0ABQ9XFT6_9EUKA|nr:hypothetical protein BLNAU_15585 [Blattamonas nauphoetae]
MFCRSPVSVTLVEKSDNTKISGRTAGAVGDQSFNTECEGRSAAAMSLLCVIGLEEQWSGMCEVWGVLPLLVRLSPFSLCGANCACCELGPLSMRLLLWRRVGVFAGRADLPSLGVSCASPHIAVVLCFVPVSAVPSIWSWLARTIPRGLGSTDQWECLLKGESGVIVPEVSSAAELKKSVSDGFIVFLDRIVSDWKDWYDDSNFASFFFRSGPQLDFQTYLREKHPRLSDFLTFQRSSGLWTSILYTIVDFLPRYLSHFRSSLS